MPGQVKVADNERVDRADLEAVIAGPAAHERHVNANFITSPGGLRLWIVSGFETTNPSGKNCRVGSGIAFLGLRDGSQVAFSQLSAEGEAQRTLDLSSRANGTYGVFIRFENIASAFQNRVFWNPLTDAEYPASIPVRSAANWGLRVELVSPGPEWLQIASVVVSASPTLAVTKQRQFFFEGYEADTYAMQWTDPTTGVQRGWGLGNDRDNNRAAYGLHSLQGFVNATLKKIEELQSGTARWWTATVEPLDQKLSRNGDTGVGNYVFNGGTVSVNGGLRCATPQAIGQAAARFNSLYLATELNMEGGAPQVILGATGVGGSAFTIRNKDNFAQYTKLSYFPALGGFLQASNTLWLCPDGTGETTAPMVLQAALVAPVVDDSVTLGTSTNRWAHVRGTAGHFTTLYLLGNTSQIIPENNLTDAGIDGNRFRDGWFNRSLHVGEALLPTVNGLPSLGADAERFAKAWLNNLDVANASLFEGGVQFGTGTAPSPTEVISYHTVKIDSSKSLYVNGMKAHTWDAGAGIGMSMSEVNAGPVLQLASNNTGGSFLLFDTTAPFGNNIQNSGNSGIPQQAIKVRVRTGDNPGDIADLWIRAYATP